VVLIDVETTPMPFEMRVAAARTLVEEIAS
jgi:hypothetical protein